LNAADGDPRPAYAGADGDALIETRVDGTRVYDGALLDVRRDRVRLPDGGEAVREYVVHPGAVLMIPVRDDGRMIVVRQFRYPQNRAFIEFPAGKLDPGETALATARRELVEEAGYRASQWTRLGVIHPVISYSTESIEIYVARTLAHVGAKLDPGEFLEVMECSADELHVAQDDGRISDAKTIAALAMHARWQAAPRRSVSMRIEGDVQGVGYRDWARRAALAARLSGWVCNRLDGAVEMRLQGERDACDALADACLEGPPSARVSAIEIAPQPFDATLTGFEQRKTR